MKTLSNKALLFATLSAYAVLSGQTFAEGVVMPGANLIAYHGVEKASSTEATGAFCAITPAKNFNAGAIGLLSARSSC
jgi:hypothetical protein